MTWGLRRKPRGEKKTKVRYKQIQKPRHKVKCKLRHNQTCKVGNKLRCTTQAKSKM